jgi:tetratricopeptide (TPR) repeat protein
LRGLGELLQQADPEAALTWLQQGLDLNAGADAEQEAALCIAAGTIHMWLGNFVEAAENLQAGLDLLPAGPSQLRATALENLGVVAVQGQGEMERGIALTQEALAISRRIHDHFKTAEILSTLGAYRNMAGDGDGAFAELHQALALAQQIGSEKLLAAVEINLGSVGLDGGPEGYADVRAHLTRGLALARKTGQSVFESISLTNLAELMIRQEEWTTAGDYLTEAETLAIALGDQLAFPVIRQGWAQIYLAQGDLPAALAEATQAVALCQEIGEALELGIALRILGEVYRANHQPQAAMTAFTESMTVLEEDYPQELARTQAKMGLGE